jgi:hypothetical protein
MEDAMFNLETLLNSIGEVSQVFTVVDYYQYIKGLEYLICLAFFIIFPMFYRFIHNEKRD